MKTTRLFALLLALFLCLSLCLVSCAKQEPEADPEGSGEASGEETAAKTPTYDYDLTPYVKPAAYQPVPLNAADIAVTDDDLVTRRLSDFGGKEVSRPVADGDTVIIDYCGKRDGVAFDGGTAQNQSLTIGSGQFIPGFEEGLIGVNPGETVDLNLTFPDPYPNNEALAGAPVVFTVTVHYIRSDSSSVPELTDEMVSLLTGYATVAEYDAAVREELQKTKTENAVWNYLLENSEFPALPEEEKTYYYDSYVQNYTSQAESYGMEFSEFLSQSGVTEEQFYEYAAEYAENQVKYDLVLYAIARAENITPTEEERTAALQKAFEMYGAQYGFADIAAMADALGEDSCNKLVIQQVLLDWLCENVSVVDGE